MSEPDYEVLHEGVAEHACGVYANLTAEGCYRAEPCATCDVRRDEHADQATNQSFPWGHFMRALAINDHSFIQRAREVADTPRS